MTPRAALVSGAIALLLSACSAVGPDYRLPDAAQLRSPDACQAFQEAGQPPFGRDDLPYAWWRLYEDPALNDLIARALVANAGLRAAAANLARSEAVVREVDGLRDPSLGAGVAIERAQVSAESYLLEHKVPVFNLGNAGLRAHYQVDLAGQLRRALEVAEAEAGAVQAAGDLARISVVADTALAYMDACAAGEALDLARRALALQVREREAIARLVAGGRRIPLDLPRAAEQEDQLRAALPAFAARRRSAAYRLAALTGQPPARAPAAAEACRHLPDLAQPIPVGDGAALLRRRPDVRQAERRLAAASARIGVATAALYPSLSFGLSAGGTGILSHLGEAPTQRWSLGPVLSWSLPGEEARARVAQADAGAAGALATLDQVVLNALQETESALATLARDRDRHAALQQARAHAETARRQVHTLYQAGRTGVLDDLDAERRLLAADARLAAHRGRLATDEIRLFLALGGGWQPGEVHTTPQ